MATQEKQELLRAVKAKVEGEEVEYGVTPMSEHQNVFPDADTEKLMRAGQDGDAWLFVRLFKDKLLFDHAAGKWYEWRGHFWEPDKVEAVLNKLDDVVNVYAQEADKLSQLIILETRQSNKQQVDHYEKVRKEYLKKIACLQKKNYKQDVLTLAAAGEEKLGCTGEGWDLNPWLLGCENGTIELKTGTFRPGQQSDYIKTVCPTEWTGIQEQPHEWRNFLRGIFDGDNNLVRFLQRLLGYAMTGTTRDHILPIFWGKGRNGKGTLFEILHYVLGPLAGPVQAEMLLDQGRARSSAAPSADIMSLRGRRIAWGSETDEGRRFNMGKVKWLVGGDTLCGREPYGRRDVSFNPSHKLFLLTNHKPKCDPDDYALWQRLHLLPFNLSFIDDPVRDNERKRDSDLPEKLKAESSAILSWLVRGCLKWQEQGLNPPEIVKNATAAYQRDEDTIGQFIDEVCIIEDLVKVRAGHLYRAYSEWSIENGLKPISGTQFGKRIKELYKDEKPNYVYYVGIGLRETWYRSNQLKPE